MWVGKGGRGRKACIDKGLPDHELDLAVDRFVDFSMREVLIGILLHIAKYSRWTVWRQLTGDALQFVNERIFCTLPLWTGGYCKQAESSRIKAKTQNMSNRPKQTRQLRGSFRFVQVSTQISSFPRQYERYKPPTASMSTKFLYEIWPSGTHFACDGRCVQGPKSQTSVLYLVGPVIILYVIGHQLGVCLDFYSQKADDPQNAGLSLSLFTLILELSCFLSFLSVSCTNPGILPRRYPTNDPSLLKQFGIDPPISRYDDDPVVFKLPNAPPKPSNPEHDEKKVSSLMICALCRRVTSTHLWCGECAEIE